VAADTDASLPLSLLVFGLDLESLAPVGELVRVGVRVSIQTRVPIQVLMEVKVKVKVGVRIRVRVGSRHSVPDTWRFLCDSRSSCITSEMLTIFRVERCRFCT